MLFAALSLKPTQFTSTSMSSLDNPIADNARTFHQALIAQTDADKLAKCTLDLRQTGIDVCSDQVSDIPRLFVVTLLLKDKTYDAYVNDRVTVADVFAQLKYRELLTVEEANTSNLIPEHNEQLPLELTDHFSGRSDGFRFRIQTKPESSLPTGFVLVKSLTGATYKINVCFESDTIAMLKAHIQTEQGIPPEQQQLIYQAKKLEDTRRLADYSIKNESVIHLVLVLRKPVIRMRSMNCQVIDNVNVSIELDPLIWELSSVYPKPSITDRTSFVQWNNMEVHPDGRIIYKQTEEMKRDLITYVLPQLDEADTNHEKQKVAFHFLSPHVYLSSTKLTVRPLPQQIIRAFLIFGFANNDQDISTLDELESEVNQVIGVKNLSNSGLVVHEWGSMFMQ